jgi:hypothetical protein
MDQPPTSFAMPGESALKATIGRHPGASAAILAVLVVVILILAYTLAHYKAMCPKVPSEGMTSGARVAAYGPCGLGETPVSYQTPDGANVTFCRSTSAPPVPPQVCGVGWDPAASAEAEALATIGSLQHDSYGEPRLQNAINAAYDSSVGLSDEQLSTLMHQGGTP